MKVREPLLGTRGEVDITTSSLTNGDLAETAVFAEVQRLENLFTIYDESSAMHALRRTGSTDVVEIETVVDLAIEWHRRTHGAFHPALQSLIDVWDTADGQAQLPDPDAIASVATDLARLADGHLDMSGLNLNGIAKGWIADRALDAAFTVTDAAVTSAWLSLGGDVAHRGERSMLVGIEDPARPYDNVAPMATVEISNEALATSGGGRRWWDIDGVRYSKVLDPRTGRPTGSILSATVIATTAAAADVLATTCLVLDPQEALKLVHREGAECFLVCANGTTKASSGRFRPA